MWRTVRSRRAPGTSAAVLISRRANPERVPAARPQLPTAERLLPYLRRIDETRVYSNWGPLCRELEARLECSLHLPPGGLACASSGTSALIAAILATSGRASTARPLAIVPAFTFAATAAAVEACGYAPYVVDISPHDWILDPTSLRVHPVLSRAGLVVPVAPYGRPVPQRAWQAFRAATGVPVVVDGAASYDRILSGARDALGEIPVALSFHATKSFSTAEGGAVASFDTDVVQRAAQALNLGFRETRESRSPSINGKLSEYHAAVGLAGLDAWTEKLAALCSVAEMYRAACELRGLSNRLVAAPDVSLAYVLFRCDDATQAAAVRGALARAGIDHRLWYEQGLHRHAAFASARRDPSPVSDALLPCLIGLPVAPDLTSVHIARAADALLEGLKERG